ncbi:MAG: methylated-DNA--[protein]-cysteine S-methyltransferase [Sulfuriflexus sp.]|nr:methylated-DNA--[protein]-cysteine S-methyltransferase [Sulfuriflexus sp.]
MIECAVEDYTAIVDSPCGMLGILDNGEVLQAINFLYDSQQARLPRSLLAEKVVNQLESFFSDPTFQFNLPLTKSITPFQLKARQALLSIPVGKTMSYGNVAKTIASSARAIAGACRRNPVPIIVPCHRIVAVNGIGGFSGAIDGKPLDNKKWLLKHESAIK